MEAYDWIIVRTPHIPEEAEYPDGVKTSAGSSTHLGVGILSLAYITMLCMQNWFIDA